MPTATSSSPLAFLLASSLAAAPAFAQHWADRPLRRPVLPATATGTTGLAIDAFVAQRHRELDLVAAPPADPRTWLRRVALDLTGLPPTPAEADAFAADTSPDARARAVDRLLASPRYAERWTQWWLDLARYADSQGYEKDALRRTMWRYRDWVLDAFANDLPFDQFTIRQLAGDLLPEATVEDRLATAFHRQTMTNSEGGTDDEEFRVAAVVDRVDTTMSVWMGATAGCAQCHDHKFDPISQREFFALYAYFDQTADRDRDDDAPLLVAPTRAQQAKLAAMASADARFAATSIEASPWHLLGPLPAADFATAHRTPFAPERDGVQLTAAQDGQRWQERPDFTDGQVHGWRGDRSAFYLHRTFVAQAATAATLSLGSDDAIVVWWNGREILRKEVGRPAAADQELLPVELSAGRNTLLLKVTNGGGPGGFYHRLEAPSYALRGGAAAPAVPVLEELPADARRTTRIHLRGNFLTQGDEVAPGTPAVWPPPPADAPANRLGFARWLVSADNPRTARVLANRIWAELFGAGLVATLEDFGSQGEAPSHPELLDWLASEFVASGWSLRHLLRTIVSSQTYAQASGADAAARERDPDNRWLTRGPSFRLTGEMLRDQALAVGGILHEQLGGPSVMPPQPDGIWMQLYSSERWVAATDAQRYRRALYTFWRRTSPHPMFLIFDAQSREACVLRRQRTNTPLQTLVLWNDPQFGEAAAALAVRTLAAEPEGDDAARLHWLWRHCLLRPASRTELGRLQQLLAAERQAGFDDASAWTTVASVVMGLDEFVTKR